jgi:hypothetical protein
MPYECKCITDPSVFPPATAKEHPAITISIPSYFAYACIAAVFIYGLVFFCRVVSNWDKIRDKISYSHGWQDGEEHGRQDIILELLETDDQFFRTEVERLCMEEGVEFDKVEVESNGDSDSEEDEDFEPDSESETESEGESDSETAVTSSEADLDMEDRMRLSGSMSCDSMRSL